MKLFRVYLRQHRGSLLVWILFCGVFALSFLLYRLPLGAVFYPTLLCLVLGLFFFGLGYARYLQRHKLLADLRKRTESLAAAMPEPESILEEDYQELIRTLREETAQVLTAAVERDQALMDYYTVWVHQIKTPITSMHLTLQNEDSPLSRKVHSDLFQIEQYVEMVLAYMRLDSESSDYVLKEYRLDAIIKQSVAKFASEFIERRILLEYEPVEQTVVTDEKWLSFVIGQILSNALKYTRKGSIKIYWQEPMTLCIEDSGIGIAPEDLPRIFEKGFTGYNGREDRKASGLGLYLCKRICDRLSVGLAVVSQLGRGTVVKIHLEQYDLKME